MPRNVGSGAAQQDTPDTYQKFFEDVLYGLGVTPNEQNLLALASIAHIEGLNNRDNPVNSVVVSGQDDPINNVGVQDYKTFKNGVQGTIDLYKGSPWRASVQEFKTGSAQDILDAISAVYHSWGGPTVPLLSGDAAEKILNMRIDSGNTDTQWDPNIVGLGTSKTVTPGKGDVISSTGILSGLGAFIQGGANDVVGGVTDIVGAGYKVFSAEEKAAAMLVIPLEVMAKFFHYLTWIFNVNHFIEFMLYIWGGAFVLGGLALITFGPSKVTNMVQEVA